MRPDQAAKLRRIQDQLQEIQTIAQRRMHALQPEHSWRQVLEHSTTALAELKDLPPNPQKDQDDERVSQ